MKTIKSFIFVTSLLISSLTFGQNVTNETENTLTVNGIEFSKDSQSFQNIFEAKYTPNTVKVNLNGLDHAFTVVHIYKNKTIIEVIGMYRNANKTKKLIKELNKTHNIKFI